MPLPIPKNSKADENAEFREQKKREVSDRLRQMQERIAGNRQRRLEADDRHIEWRARFDFAERERFWHAHGRAPDWPPITPADRAWRPTYEDHRRRIVRYPAYIPGQGQDAPFSERRFRIITVTFINTGIQPRLITHGPFRPHNVYQPRHAGGYIYTPAELDRIRANRLRWAMPFEDELRQYDAPVMVDDAWPVYQFGRRRNERDRDVEQMADALYNQPPRPMHLQDGHARWEVPQEYSEEERARLQEIIRMWREAEHEPPALQIARGYPHHFIDRDSLQEIIDANEGVAAWLNNARESIHSLAQDVAGAMNISPEAAGEPETSQMSALQEIAQRRWAEHSAANIQRWIDRGEFDEEAAGAEDDER